jgi:hypothetical protein
LKKLKLGRYRCKKKDSPVDVGKCSNNEKKKWGQRVCKMKQEQCKEKTTYNIQNLKIGQIMKKGGIWSQMI